MCPQVLVHLLERRPRETCEGLYGELRMFGKEVVNQLKRAHIYLFVGMKRCIVNRLKIYLNVLRLLLVEI